MSDLSPSQLRILQTIRRFDDKDEEPYVEDIANELGLNVKTVKVHVANLCRKLGITERVTLAEMVGVAEQQGVDLGSPV